MLPGLELFGWMLLDSGLRVRVSYERDYHENKVSIAFRAEREPTPADRSEMDWVMEAIVANSPALGPSVTIRTVADKRISAETEE